MSAMEIDGAAGGSEHGGMRDMARGLLHRLFFQQRDLITQHFQDLDYDQVTKLAQMIVDCKGVVFLTGIGKNGFIAQKVAMTLVSTATKALFLQPTDALHGDLGICSPDDILIMFDRLGESEQLIGMLPYVKAKGVKLVSVVCKPTSKLARVTDLHIYLPLERELCPFNQAPVTSASIQMLFGSTIAVAVMQHKGLTKEQYAMNHPAGRIGKRLLLKISDVMQPYDKLPCCTGEEIGLNALVRLSGSSKGCGCLLVVDGDRKLLGTFSDGDLRRALTKAEDKDAILKAPVSMLMNYQKQYPRCMVLGGGPETMAVDAMVLMEGPPAINYLPIIKEDKTLVGLVTQHEFLEAGL